MNKIIFASFALLGFQAFGLDNSELLRDRMNGTKLVIDLDSNNGLDLFLELHYDNCDIVMGDEAVLKDLGVEKAVQCDMDLNIGIVQAKTKAYITGDDTHFKIKAAAFNSKDLTANFGLNAVYDESNNTLSGNGTLKGYYTRKVSGTRINIKLDESFDFEI